MKILPMYIKTIRYAVIFCFSLSWGWTSESAEGVENPMLKWKVGDHWAVKTYWGTVNYARGKLVQGKGSPFFVQFEVSGISTTSFGQCYVVKMAYPKEPNGFQFSYLLYYSCKDGRLTSVIDDSTRSDGSKMHMRYKFDISTNTPALTDRIRSDIRLDQPVFSAADTNLIVQEENRDIKQQVLRDEKGQGYTTVITVKSKNGEERRIVQKWEPGLPWWKEMKEYRGEELVAEQELVLDEKPAKSEKP